MTFCRTVDERHVVTVGALVGTYLEPCRRYSTGFVKMAVAEQNLELQSRCNPKSECSQLVGKRLDLGYLRLELDIFPQLISRRICHIPGGELDHRLSACLVKSARIESKTRCRSNGLPLGHVNHDVPRQEKIRGLGYGGYFIDEARQTPWEDKKQFSIHRRTKRKMT